MSTEQVNMKYIEGKVEETKKYFESELAVLDSVKSYDAIQKYIDQLPERLTYYFNISLSKNFTNEPEREIYESKVYSELKDLSLKYDNPMLGSVPEEIAKTIKHIADNFRS